MTGIYTILDFLEAIGCTFEMDWDGEVTPHVPHDIDVRLVSEMVVDNADLLKRYLEIRRHKAAHQFVGGGSMQGKVHSLCVGDHLEIPLGRALWEAYAVPSMDGRAIYCGQATSRAKARKLAYGRLAKSKSLKGTP